LSVSRPLVLAADVDERKAESSRDLDQDPDPKHLDVVDIDPL